MSKEEALQHVRSVMVELFEIDPQEVQLSAHLIDDLDLDSIDAIDMAARLQEMTGRRVSEEALKSMRTVSDVVDLVRDELAEASRGSSPDAPATRPA